MVFFVMVTSTDPCSCWHRILQNSVQLSGPTPSSPLFELQACQHFWCDEPTDLPSNATGIEWWSLRKTESKPSLIGPGSCWSSGEWLLHSRAWHLQTTTVWLYDYMWLYVTMINIHKPIINCWKQLASWFWSQISCCAAPFPSFPSFPSANGNRPSRLTNLAKSKHFPRQWSHMVPCGYVWKWAIPPTIAI